MPQPPSPKTGRHLGAGLTFAVVVGLFVFGGNMLDEAWDCSPWFLLVGLMLGGVGGFLHLIATVAPELLPFKKRPPDKPE